MEPCSELFHQLLLLGVLICGATDGDLVLPTRFPVDLGHVLGQEAAEDAVVDVELIEAGYLIHRAHGCLPKVLDVRSKLLVLAPQALEVATEVMEVAEKRLERTRS